MRLRPSLRVSLLGCVLLALLLWLTIQLFGDSGSSSASPNGQSSVIFPDGAGAQAGTTASKQNLLDPPGLYFGIATPSAPDKGRTDEVVAAAGARPTVQEYFLKWNQDFDDSAFQEAYDLGAVPLLTWEPWTGGDQKVDDPDYALAKIASGAHDSYIRDFAQAARKAGKPVILRFGHEMNEPWYQWSEDRNGNKKGDYIAAWRHVHDVFQRQGATNVIWYWCPDLRQTTDKDRPPLAQFYPGDSYVDWIGMDAYSTGGEETAGEVMDSTYKELTALSAKPIFIGETGAKPTEAKALWTIDFFNWLKDHPRVIGFCWFYFSQDQGGRYDWRFTTSPGAKDAFKEGLKDQKLVSWPVS